MIRTLKPGEEPPVNVEPYRYKNSQGYIRLRWLEAPGVLVECYEHRWVMGNPPAEFHVHHKNGVRDDNRPENLEVLTPEAHSAEHRTIDRAEARRLYEDGLSTVAVGAAMGHHPSAIYRALRDEGVRIRSIGESLRMSEEILSLEDIRFLHTRGVRARRIAKLFGVSSFAVDQRVREMGLTPHPGGRPSDADLESAAAAILELTG